MKLLEPLDINGMVIPNRTLVPAMVTRLSGEDGYVNQDIIDRYVRYAEGEIGLIVVEAMGIHSARSGPLLRIGEDRFNDGHRELVDRVHDASGSKIVPQIIHFMKVARSGWRQTIDSLSIGEIDDIIAQFGAAAARASTRSVRTNKGYKLIAVTPVPARSNAISLTMRSVAHFRSHTWRPRT